MTVLPCRVDGVEVDAIAASARRHRNIHAGYLGANVCAQNDDRDGSNRCKKILEAAQPEIMEYIMPEESL